MWEKLDSREEEELIRILVFVFNIEACKVNLQERIMVFFNYNESGVIVFFRSQSSILTIVFVVMDVDFYQGRNLYKYSFMMFYNEIILNKVLSFLITVESLVRHQQSAR